MAYVPGNAQDWTRQIQTNEEVIRGEVNQNSTWKNVGIGASLGESVPMIHLERPILGGEDIHGDIRTGEATRLSMTWGLIDTRWLRYCTELALGTGTIAMSNSILHSQLVDDVEKSRVYLGCICDSVSLQLEKSYTANANFFAMGSTDWEDEAALAARLGASWIEAPALTSQEFTHTSAGADPFTLDGTPMDVARLTIDINRNAQEQRPNGLTGPKYIKRGARRIRVTLDTWLKGDTNKQLVTDMLPHTLVYKLDGTGTDITLTGVKFNDYRCDSAADANDFQIETLVGVAQHIVVDPLTVIS
ncbi:MAG TPA: phage tail tube protein [Nitrososphaera sp.]|jgi:hypothetical protein